MKKRVVSSMLSAVLVTSLLVGCGSTSGTGASATTDTSSADVSATTEAAASTATATEDTAAAASSGNAVDTNDDGTVNNPEAVAIKEGDLSFWSLFTGGDGEWFGKIADQYNATNPDDPVDVVTLVWADYYTKLQTAVSTGNGPDIGVSHVSKLYELAETGAIQPIDDYLDQLGINLSDYYEQASIDSVTVDGHIYAIPLDTHAEVMYYNLDLLEKAGISEDDVKNVKSSEDFEALLKKCKDNLDSDVSPLSITASGDDPFRLWYAIYFQMGGTDFVNADATENTIDPDIAKKAMEYVKSLYDNGYILPGIDDHQALFQSGKAAFLFAGLWATGTFEETDGLNFNNADFPSLFGSNQQCWADSHTLVIPTKESRTDDQTLSAVKFIFYASNDGGITWAGSGQIPAAKKANQSEEYKTRKGYNVVDELNKAKYAPKATHYYSGMKVDIQDALDSYWTGVNDIDTAYDALSAGIDDNLD